MRLIRHKNSKNFSENSKVSFSDKIRKILSSGVPESILVTYLGGEQNSKQTLFGIRLQPAYQRPKYITICFDKNKESVTEYLDSLSNENLKNKINAAFEEEICAEIMVDYVALDIYFESTGNKFNFIIELVETTESGIEIDSDKILEIKDISRFEVEQLANFIQLAISY